MNVILTVIIGSLMVALGYYERGYWAFGGEAIIELACIIYLIVLVIGKLRGGRHV